MKFGRPDPHRRANGGEEVHNSAETTNHYGFSVWMAGGGSRAGLQSMAATDDFGFKRHQRSRPASTTSTPRSCTSWEFDHERLTYRYAAGTSAFDRRPR